MDATRTFDDQGRRRVLRDPDAGHQPSPYRLAQNAQRGPQASTGRCAATIRATQPPVTAPVAVVSEPAAEEDYLLLERPQWACVPPHGEPGPTPPEPAGRHAEGMGALPVPSPAGAVAGPPVRVPSPQAGLVVAVPPAEVASKTTRGTTPAHGPGAAMPPSRLTPPTFGPEAICPFGQMTADNDNLRVRLAQLEATTNVQETIIARLRAQLQEREGEVIGLRAALQQPDSAQLQEREAQAIGLRAVPPQPDLVGAAARRVDAARPALTAAIEGPARHLEVAQPALAAVAEEPAQDAAAISALPARDAPNALTTMRGADTAPSLQALVDDGPLEQDVIRSYLVHLKTPNNFASDVAAKYLASAFGVNVRIWRQQAAHWQLADVCSHRIAGAHLTIDLCHASDHYRHFDTSGLCAPEQTHGSLPIVGTTDRVHGAGGGGNCLFLAFADALERGHQALAQDPFHYESPQRPLSWMERRARGNMPTLQRSGAPALDRFGLDDGDPACMSSAVRARLVSHLKRRLQPRVDDERALEAAQEVARDLLHAAADEATHILETAEHNWDPADARENTDVARYRRAKVSFALDLLPRGENSRELRRRAVALLEQLASP